MRTTKLKRTLACCVIPVAVISIASCDGGYTTNESYDVSEIPVKKNKTKGHAQTKTLKPTVKFPARLAVVKVRGDRHGDLILSNNQTVERPEYKKKLAGLHGLAGVVNLNNTSGESGEVTYPKLQSSARRFGANMLGVYRFNTSTQRKNGASVFQLASLGLAPVNRHKSNSAVSLTLMDTKTGYIYGVLEESANKRTLSSSWGNDNAEENTETRAEQAALDELMEKFPEFWNRTYERHQR